MNSIEDITRYTVPKPEGIEYFKQHPSKIADLIKIEGRFNLAREYFTSDKGFKPADINAIVNKARENNQRIVVKHYTVVEKMIRILLDNYRYGSLGDKYYCNVELSLPDMIVDFISKLDKENTLDFEFTGRIMSSNTVLQELAKLSFAHGHLYKLIETLINCMSPPVVMQQLLGRVKLKYEPTLLHYFLENLSQSKDVVLQVIRHMQELRLNNFSDFKDFIAKSKVNDYDLLHELKTKSGANSEIVKAFCAIAPNFLKESFPKSKDGIVWPNDTSSVTNVVSFTRNPTTSTAAHSSKEIEMKVLRKMGE